MPEPRDAAADTPMLADIRRQPDVLAALAAREAEVTAFGDAHLRATPGGRVWVFGSGDGWFAARAALTGAAMGQAASGLDFVVNVAPQLGPDDRALAISMSGSSRIDSHASSEFSTSSRMVVYRLLPGLSKPAMFLFSEKNSAGDLKRSTSPRAVVMPLPSFFGGIRQWSPNPASVKREHGSMTISITQNSVNDIMI